MPLKQLDGVQIKKIFGAGTAWLEQHAPFVNSLNVFPVPDGDSGTNMLLTMQAALREVEKSPSHSAGVILTALSHGALLGARGNSGVILSQIIRGIARSADGREGLNTTEFAAAMVEASRTAYNGVVKPVEGTILTVVRESADATTAAAQESDDFIVVMDRTVEAARLSVQRTPQLLPVLQEAGVVDAGGQGLLVILEGMLKYLKGEPLQLSAQGVSAENLEHISREEGWGYDIQFHIRGQALDVNAIREQISSMGESALIVGDETLIKVHVHAPNPGDIVKYGAEQGALVNIIIENMQEQYVDFMAGHTADQRVGAENMGAREAQPPMRPTLPIVKTEDLVGIGTVAVVPGQGLQQIFESLGAGAVVGGGPTMNPSTQDLLDAINTIKADRVLILPNDKNIILAATQTKQLTSKHIEIIPTRTVPQGIAALLAFNYMADMETNVTTMTAAARRMRTVEVTTATRSARINGLQVREGQYIGLIDGELAGADDDRDALTIEMLNRAEAPKGEILTVYYGSELNAVQAQQAIAQIQSAFPRLEIEVHAGGQPLYPFIISVE
ncbi:MAG: DAK2 domain-containing protein [Anaerolineae bacterium]